MARLALHPQVTGAVDVAPHYRMEEIEVTPGCPGAGRPIADIAGSAIVPALYRPGGELVPQPSGETVLRPGDVLIAIGTASTMDRLEALFAPTEARAERPRPGQVT
jgi:voltage-gated potassium channel